MATQAQIQATIAEATQVFNRLYAYTSGNFNTDFLAVIDTYQSDYDILGPMTDAIESTRSSLGAVVDQASSVLSPLLLQYARIDDSGASKDEWPETSPLEILDQLYRHMKDNSLTVESRAFTWGGPPAMTGTGNGKFYRVKSDYAGFDIETAVAETVECLCVQDANSGSPIQQEVFELRGGAAALDSGLLGGTGIIENISGLSCSDSSAFISNPSFTSYTGTKTSVTGITGWTMVTDAAVFTDVNIDTTTTYRTFAGEGATPASLKFIGDDGVKQVWQDRSLSFDEDTPYYVHVAEYHPAGTTASIVLTFGNTTTTVTLDSSNKEQWNLIQLTAAPANAWFRTFNKNDGEIKIAVTGVDPTSSSEYVLIDDVTIGPMTQYANGEWYALVGGATPFVVGDNCTWDTTGGTSGIIQRWVAQAFGKYLPSTTGTPTWAEPT